MSGPPAPRSPANASSCARHVSLATGHSAIALWLWFARCAFVGAPFRWWPDAIGIGLAAAGLAWAIGLHRTAGSRPVFRAGGALAFAAALAAVIAGCGAVGLISASPAAALWFGCACGAISAAYRLGFGAARATWPDRPGEAGRWLLVGAGAVAVTLPFYRQAALGSGDASWYVIMLADFVTQFRHGTFPIWAGQSEFAFNGAVLPLRVAPWFQHMGGLLEILTAHSLAPTTLVNAVVSVNGLAVGASAYGSLRSVLPRRPGIAAALALLWLACPGVVAPLYLGDQYMTFMAMPFLPLLLAGCWRLWDRDDAPARALIVIGLAGLWLSHTPIAVWGSFLGAGIYAGHLLARPRRAEFRRLAWMAALFLALGSLPVASALLIDNPNRSQSKGETAWTEIARTFPESLKPINSKNRGLSSFQLGYSLAAAGVAALILLAWLRPRGAGAFGLSVAAVGLFIVPVPGITRWIWMHLPSLVVTIDNVWPMQRLYSIWGAVVAFALAAAAADARISGRGRRAAVLLAALACGCAWSASQADKLIEPIRATFSNEQGTALLLRPENIRLTRYAYTSFAAMPEYFSHGYTDPLLENRLLARDSLAVMTANADAAAPQLRLGDEPATVPRLVQTGVWTGVSEDHSGIYDLQPSLVPLEPGRHYALRLDFAPPEPKGLLQILGEGLFREYLLPDSGAGMSMKGPPMSFGALPTSGRVLPLMFRASGPRTPLARFYLSSYGGERMDFARFWLFSYELADLPVRVLSWVPYRAETETAVPAYLETPRVWQSGWTAEVNGRPTPVLVSPHNLAMIPIEPGSSSVTLEFRAPLWLDLLFWIHVASWTGIVCLAAAQVVRRALPTAKIASDY